MKTLITLSILLAGLMISCSVDQQEQQQLISNQQELSNMTTSMYLDTNNVIVRQGCEYFVVDVYRSYNYIHKGNCKNPIHYCKCK